MRVKRGFVRKRRHHKVILRTKGFRMTKGRLYKVSREADLHAGQYSFVGRKDKKSRFRKLWIQRINAGLESHQLSYSRFQNLLKKAKISINRKILADLLITHPSAFDKIVETAKKTN